MSAYNIIAASNESTVVAEYTPESSRSDSFQSEAALEKEFIRLLTTQGYEHLTIHDENSLISNLRRQLELFAGRCAAVCIAWTAQSAADGMGTGDFPV